MDHIIAHTTHHVAREATHHVADEIFSSHHVGHGHHNPHMEVHFETSHHNSHHNHHGGHVDVHFDNHHNKHHHHNNKVEVHVDPVAVDVMAHTLSNVSFGVAAASAVVAHEVAHDMAHGVKHMIKDVAKSVSAVFGGMDVINSANRIWVTLSQPSYVGGDMVYGTVEMDCLVPFVAKGVLIKLKGFERVWFQQQVQEWEGEGQNRKAVMKTKEHKENKEFFRSTIVVYPHSGTVNAGHFSFPFQYQLPASLPGTYFEEGGNKHQSNAYYAKILYKAKATVDVAFRHDLKSTTKLVINEKFDQLLKPSFGENSKSFLIGGGNLHIRTWLDKNAYFPGETVICKMKANNTSVKPTRKINIKVHHHLELKAHGQHFNHSHVVYEQHFPGFDPCFLGVKWMPFFIPINLRPSSLQGHHVKSEYMFQIECDIPGAIDLSVALPCRLLAPQFLYSTIPPQPANAPLPPNISTRPPWQADDSVTKCTHCSTDFTLFKRRHHCRHCHKVYCGNCTKQKTPIKRFKYKTPVRVCDKCMPVASLGGEKFQSTKIVYQQWQQQTMPQI